MVHVQLKPSDIGIYTIAMLNVEGKTVFTKVININSVKEVNNYSILLNNYPEGLYLIRLINPDGSSSFSSKFINLKSDNPSQIISGFGGATPRT